MSSAEEQVEDKDNQWSRHECPGSYPRSAGNEEAPLLGEVYPDLSRELITLLEAEGESNLAVYARGLRIISPCKCQDDFCQSFYTAPPPEGAYGPGHRNVVLDPKHGMLILDVVNNQIMYVEVLHQPPLAKKHVT